MDSLSPSDLTDERSVIFGGGVSLCLNFSHDELRLRDSATLSPRDPASGIALQTLCNWVDRHGIKCTIVDAASGGGYGESLGEMLAWYGRFGFTSLCGTSTLTRRCNIQAQLGNALSRKFCDACHREEFANQIGGACSNILASCAGRVVSPYEWTLARSRTHKVDPKMGVLSGFLPIDLPPGQFVSIYDENGVACCVKDCGDNMVWLDEIKAYVGGHHFGRLAMGRFCAWLDQHNLVAGLRIGALGVPRKTLTAFYASFGFRRDRHDDYVRYPGGALPESERRYFADPDVDSREGYGWTSTLRRLGRWWMSRIGRKGI